MAGDGEQVAVPGNAGDGASVGEYPQRLVVDHGSPMHFHTHSAVLNTRTLSYSDSYRLWHRVPDSHCDCGGLSTVRYY